LGLAAKRSETSEDLNLRLRLLKTTYKNLIKTFSSASPNKILVKTLWKFPEKKLFLFYRQFLYIFVFNEISLASAVDYHGYY